jgi:hypothetical protein
MKTCSPPRGLALVEPVARKHPADDPCRRSGSSANAAHFLALLRASCEQVRSRSLMNSRHFN